jgi:plastocyanin
MILMRRLRIAAVILFGVCAVALLVITERHRSSVAIHSTPKEQPGTQNPDRAPVPVVPDVPGHPIEPAPKVVSPNLPVLASNVSITGRVFYHGTAPKRHAIDMHLCPQCVDAAHGTLYDESVVVNEDGTLQNVTVAISGGLPPGARFSVPSEPVLLDQKGCRFDPHVVATMVGQTVMVRNSDPCLHSVHSMDADQSPAFDFAQPTIGQRLLEPLQTVETFKVKCDLHPWMSAWIRVFNHPYFSVTRGDGAFTIKRLPPGKYTIKAWHEWLGVQEKEITVIAGKPIKIDFTFEPRAALAVAMPTVQD